MLVIQSCPTICNPTDGSLPGFSDHGILQAKNTGGNHSLRDQTPDILHDRQISYHLRHQGRSKPANLKGNQQREKTQTYGIYIPPRINPKKN